MKLMKIIYSVLIISFLIFGFACKHDCYKTIYGVKLYPIKQYIGQVSEETEFLNSSIFFEVDFLMDADRFLFGRCRIPIINVNNEMVPKFYFSCNRDLFIDGDTLEKNSNIFEYFDFKRLDNRYNLNYRFKNKQAFYNEDGYYKFYFFAKLTDNSEHIDSCTVKINF